MPINHVLCYAIPNKSKLLRRWISAKKVLNISDAENVQQAYTKARNKFKAMIRKSKREFERNIGIQPKNNPKIFWSHVRSKLKTKTGVPPLLQDEKDETSTKFDGKGKRIFFKNNLLVFLQKNRMLKCLFSIKRLT